MTAVVDAVDVGGGDGATGVGDGDVADGVVVVVDVGVVVFEHVVACEMRWCRCGR